MPEKQTRARARQDRREGKAPSTQAGEFVHEEIEHIREGKHGARSTKQAIAIGLSKARRAGVPLSPPARGKRSTKQSARRALAQGRRGASPPRSSRRSRSAQTALRREPRRAASSTALSRQARTAARSRARARSRKK
jgi:hypothetical protein